MFENRTGDELDPLHPILDNKFCLKTSTLADKHNKPLKDGSKCKFLEKLI